MNKHHKTKQLTAVLGFVVIVISLGAIITLTETQSSDMHSTITGFAVSKSGNRHCLEIGETLCLENDSSTVALEDCLLKAKTKCKNV